MSASGSKNLEAAEVFRFDWAMPIKRASSAPQLELGVAPQNGNKHPVAAGVGVQLHYETKGGQLYLGDSIEWMKSLPSGSVDLVFADPPYNVKKAEWDTFESHAQYVSWSEVWIAQASRILKPDGTLHVCGYSEILASILVAVMPLFRGCRWLVWHYKNKANLGSDWGRSHESIIHLRKGKTHTLNVDEVRIPYGAHTLKYPEHPQAETSQYGGNGNGKNRETWKPHPLGAKPKDVFDIPTTCNGMGEKTPHPTQKPEELVRKLLLASSSTGDTVLDPFSGSGTTAVVAEQLGRRWLACDNNPQYNEWAINRLNTVVRRSVADWIRFDAETAQRRESIR